MTAIIVLIVCSLIVAGGFLAAFLLSVKSGQYDDTYTPAVRMLFDENKSSQQEHEIYPDSSEIKPETRNSKL